MGWRPRTLPLRGVSVHIPMKDVEGKVAFITGGSSGIGLGIARACAEAGMKVAFGYRTKTHAEEALAQLGNAAVHAICVDVTDRPGMRSAAAEVVRVFGKVHVLFNNAGVQNPSTLSKMLADQWDRLMDVNVHGVFNGIQAFLPHIMQHGEGGHIVATSSIVGLFTAGESYAAYCASKFAVVAMMESLRSELSPSNVGVSVLCPGPVKSNLEEFLRNYELASDPLEIGRLTLQGIRNNDLYILTHPEFNTVVQCRNDTIVGSCSRSARPTAARKALVESVLARTVYHRSPVA
jgi:NAD(P)-dependent dehydrogenase (short-subunit alcohol dehydrogenase family)